MNPSVCVVGVGADGWPGLGPTARHELSAAEVIIGSERQLALLPPELGARRCRWPSPMLPAVPELLEEYRGKRLCVLASGDPMFYGVGSTLVRLLGADGVRVITHPSSVALACARLGWAVEEVEVLSAVGRHLAALQPLVQPGRKVLVLVAAADAAARIAALLGGRGFGPSRITVLERLGADERLVSGTVDTWSHAPHDPLAVVAIECVPGAEADIVPRGPGLAEAAYDTDGQITKREVRAVTLALLAPTPGQLLWDVGAGSGSIGIEWMRSHAANRAVAIEPRADSLARIAANALALGVPGLQVIEGSAPEALAGLPTPDAVFVGGAVSRAGVLDATIAALPPGGRLVANAVTLESEATLIDQQARLGGDLTRIAIQRAEPIGGFTAWRPALPVTIWSYRKGN